MIKEADLVQITVQNLRRFVGYDIQYFAAVEPQRRLAPHVHLAMRGTVSRAELREVIAATYHQVWWPSTDPCASRAPNCPSGTKPRSYLDPATGEVLPTWDEALDAIGDQDEPLHVARFGDRFDAQGVIAGSKDANRCIGYLTKYLTKHVAECHHAETGDQERHAERLADALRYEPCSPTCANWLRYGIQPKNAKPHRPGACRGKAHRREYLGYAGRRVLVSRKWSGKTLTDHRADRKNWLPTPSGFRQPTPAATPGNPSTLATTTTCHPRNACCTSSPTASAGNKHSTRHEDAPKACPPTSFRQLGTRHDGVANDGLTRADLFALPVVIDVATAARALGLGRSTAYELARRASSPAASFISAALTAFPRPTCFGSWALTRLPRTIQHQVSRLTTRPVIEGRNSR